MSLQLGMRQPQGDFTETSILLVMVGTVTGIHSCSLMSDPSSFLPWMVFFLVLALLPANLTLRYASMPAWVTAAR